MFSEYQFLLLLLLFRYRWKRVKPGHKQHVLCLCFLISELVSDPRVKGVSLLSMRVIAVLLEGSHVKGKEHGLWIQLNLGSKLGSVVSPGGAVAKTVSSQCWGPGFDPWLGNWIPHTTAKTLCSQINKNELKKKYIYIKLRIVRQGVQQVGKKYSIVGNNFFLFSFNVHCNTLKRDSQDGVFTSLSLHFI